MPTPEQDPIFLGNTPITSSNRSIFRINKSMQWKWKWELRSAIVPCRIEFESLSAFFDFIERDEGWRWGLRSEMKGEGEGWDRQWRVRVTAWDWRDGGWRLRSEMEGEGEIGDGGWEIIGGGWGWDRRWTVRVMAWDWRDRGWRLRSEMKGEAEGWDWRWRLGSWSGSWEINGEAS